MDYSLVITAVNNPDESVTVFVSPINANEVQEIADVMSEQFDVTYHVIVL